MSGRPKVLVTGAQEHQGLAVIRGLGMAGYRVVACGTERYSIGFASRYTTETARYTPPFESAQRFCDDILRIVRRTRPALVMPTVESTLVLLSERRALVERYAPLAAPSRSALACALDKSETLRLADRHGVPTPRSARGDSIAAILAQAEDLVFPVAIKPRGNALHKATANALGFKVRYARDPQELAAVIAPLSRDARALLVQEYAPGVGRCVSALCRHGEPLALFAYAREREYPLSGGVSVLRRTIPLDPRLAEWATDLLRALDWHGVAMVEFKYDRRSDEYMLMEINGRFQASTALSLDAGLNLPGLAASMYLGRPVPAAPAARLGVRERWLRGDLLALREAFRLGVLFRFLGDFLRPGIHYDEFRLRDWKPGVVEACSLAGLVAGWIAKAVLRPVRQMLRGKGRPVTAVAPAPPPRGATARPDSIPPTPDPTEQEPVSVG